MNDFLRRLLYLPEQASSVAGEIDTLHFFVIGITMVGATGVFIAAIWWSVRYRARTLDELATTPRVQAGLAVEGGLLAFLIVLFIVFWVVGFTQFLRIRVPPKDAMVVYVTGKQWMWKFAYPEGKQTINTLVVPAERDVHLVMTSRDVIHSFYVPAFRIKQDVLPGRYYSMWFRAMRPGTYRIFCAEYCGLMHSAMMGDVVALDPDEYQLWLEGEPLESFVDLPPGPARGRVVTELGPGLADYPRGIPEASPPRSMADHGREVAALKGCLACHTLDGQPHIGPTWRNLWYRETTLADGRVVIADEAYLTRSMMDPMLELVQGYAPVMPTYQGLLEPAEVGAILELIRTISDPLPTPARYPEPLVRPPSAPGTLDRVGPARALEFIRETSERVAP
jgi:cytochrome c oxidase subunit 2